MKDVANQNILLIFFTLDTFQLLSGWLKEVAPENIFHATYRISAAAECSCLNRQRLRAPSPRHRAARGVLSMGKSKFNDDISAWDTSNVTDMSYMFHGAKSFNQPLNDWCVDNVTNMRGMFSCVRYKDDGYGGYYVRVIRGSSFNQPLNDWRVDNVTDMREMFAYASSFNQPLNDWRVDKVTNMGGMFINASAFNQPLNDWRVDNFTPSPTPGGCCAIS